MSVSVYLCRTCLGPGVVFNNNNNNNRRLVTLGVVFVIH